MTTAMRLLIRMAEEEGLVYRGVLNGTSHYRLLFENRLGQRLIKLAPHGARSGMGASRQAKNSRAQFRRFARGHTHGLMVLPAQVITSANDSDPSTQRAS